MSAAIRGSAPTLQGSPSSVTQWSRVTLPRATVPRPRRGPPAHRRPGVGAVTTPLLVGGTRGAPGTGGEAAPRAPLPSAGYVRPGAPAAGALPLPGRLGARRPARGRRVHGRVCAARPRHPRYGSWRRRASPCRRSSCSPLEVRGVPCPGPSIVARHALDLGLSPDLAAAHLRLRAPILDRDPPVPAQDRVGELALRPLQRRCNRAVSGNVHRPAVVDRHYLRHSLWSSRMTTPPTPVVVGTRGGWSLFGSERP